MCAGDCARHWRTALSKIDLFLFSHSFHIAGVTDLALVVSYRCMSTVKVQLARKRTSFHHCSTQFFNEENLKIGVRFRSYPA